MSNQSVVSLFSGIGGFEAGFAGLPLDVELFCEKDPAARSVLNARFPGVRVRHDIAGMRSLPRCDVVVGGWPCQDLSQAGRVAGLSGENSGLVRHVFRLLDATPKKPNVVILENVAFALRLQKGRAIRHVVDELSARGYNWAYRVLDTREFGLPHRRRRVFICGMLDGDPAGALFAGIGQSAPIELEPRNVGFYWTEGNRGVGWTVDAVPPLKGGSGLSIPSPPAIWDTHTGAIRVPGIEDAERLQGFEAGWTLSARNKKRGDRERWRLVGNAVSVPVAAWIGKRLVTGKPYSRFESLGTEELVTHNAAWGGPGRSTRYIADAGEGPDRRSRMTVAKFGLKESSPLSRRAAEGFLRRYMKSGLVKNLEFAGALARHCGLPAIP